QMWGTCSSSHKAIVLRPERVQAVGAAIEERSRRARAAESTVGPFGPNMRRAEMQEWDIHYTTELARFLESPDILRDVYSAVSECILKNITSAAMKGFFTLSAQMGFLEGLALLPANHPLISNSPEESLLPHAICSKHLPTIQFLLEKGAIDIADCEALKLCITQCLGFQSELDYDILKLLLNFGFDANAPFKDKESVRNLVNDDRYEFLQLLLNHRANPTSLTSRQRLTTPS
ncbi:hypothetical protein HDU96_010668, partial [Phlyctochytrium bullatum]